MFEKKKVTFQILSTRSGVEVRDGHVPPCGYEHQSEGQNRPEEEAEGRRRPILAGAS